LSALIERAKIHKLMESHKDPAIVILMRALPPAVVGVMVFQIALLIGGLMIGSIMLGLFIDTQAGTRPLFTLLLAFVSLPLSVWLTYRVALRTVSKARAAYQAYQESKHATTAEAQSQTSQTSSATDPLARAGGRE
jgi:hypothetical protein